MYARDDLKDFLVEGKVVRPTAISSASTVSRYSRYISRYDIDSSTPEREFQELCQVDKSHCDRNNDSLLDKIEEQNSAIEELSQQVKELASLIQSLVQVSAHASSSVVSHPLVRSESSSEL